MMLQRRGLLLGLLAAPAVIRTPGLLMAVKAPVEDDWLITGPPQTGLLAMRDILLPRLREVFADYRDIPIQWEEVFKAPAA